MRAIQGVCIKRDHALDFTTGLSSRRRVQSQAPSLIMVLIARQDSPPHSHRNNKRLGREQEGGGGARSRDGEGLSWAPVAELPLPPLRYTNYSFGLGAVAVVAAVLRTVVP